MAIQDQITLLIVGAVLALAGSLINFAANFIAARVNAKKDQKINFESKVSQLRLDAAQTAYQYIYKIHRSSSRKVLTQNLADDARDWLDGEAIILGDDIYTSVFAYFNHVSTGSAQSEQNKAMQRAIDNLKLVIKEPFSTN